MEIGCTKQTRVRHRLTQTTRVGTFQPYGTGGNAGDNSNNEDTQMATMNAVTTVTLKQAAQLIMACPENRFLLRGEPGIGKSSLLKVIQGTLGLQGRYIDVPNMDLGDIAMPVIDHESKTTKYYPNARFGLHEGKAVAIMLDEFSKGADPVKNMLHPLLEVVNPRLGDVPVPKGSTIFLTGNLSSDGVGDNIKAHTKMRLTELVVAKPTAAEWLLWAADNDIHPTLMAWVDRTPDCLASYLDGGQDGNPYIFFPNKVQGAVVTPRTLELASNVIHKRDEFDAGALHAALVGTVGAPAAASIAGFIAHQDSLPPWKDIIEHPLTTRVLDQQGALAVLVYGAMERVDNKTLPPFLEYIGRAEAEWGAIFCLALARSKTKQSMAFGCKAFADWARLNEDIL